MAFAPAPPLLVDLYELTMLDAYRREGLHDEPSTFSLFVRRLPATRGYLVAAGLDDALAWLEALRFGDAELAALDALDRFDADFLDWLRGFRFTGSVRAVPEGTLVFADEPLLEVDAPLGEAQVAESLLLNQLTLQTMLASKAARCREAAAGRPVVDFALRRCQGVDAALKLARVSRLVGLAGTSNVEGAARYGLAASGTMAHAYVQAHGDETDAFASFTRAYGDGTVLLVDTYDTAQGLRRAAEVARAARDDGIRVSAVRLDSGDLAELAHLARRTLDDAGLNDVGVFVSGSLDEHRVAALVAAGAPIDGFGVGTAMGTSADAPSLDTVYKLVELAGRPVRKTAVGKRTWAGRKQVWRAHDRREDVLALHDEHGPGPGYEPLLIEVMVGGERTAAGREDLATANARFEAELAALPAAVRRLEEPAPYPVRISAGLEALTARLDQSGVGGAGTGEAGLDHTPGGAR